MSAEASEGWQGTHRPSVFLSYASEDRPAARALRDALPDYGLDVWYDESELGGGEAWDQKIRRQIRECDYFMPLVSARTEARLEGYFRREWRLAVERTLDMADDHLFLLPIVIDETNQATARVPEKFLQVQWLKVPGGQPTKALEAMCRRVAGGNAAAPDAGRKPQSSGQEQKPAGSGQSLRGFPREEPGRRLQYCFDVIIWAIQSLWPQFQRLPRWVRIIAYLWLLGSLASRCDSDHQKSTDATPTRVEKPKAVALNSQDLPSKADLTKLGSQIVKDIADDADDDDAVHPPILAVPFAAPDDDAAGQKLADSAFAMAYGKLNLTHQGAVSVAKEPLASHELGAALERARTNHAQYVLWGIVNPADGPEVLTIKIAKVQDGSISWSKSYEVADADPAKIASDVNAHLPAVAAE